MPNSNLTLNMSAADTFVSDKTPTVTYSVTLHEGITGTYKESATATESKPLNAASDKGAGVTQVPNGAVITITGLEGAVAIAQGTPLAVAGATTYAKDANITISSASVELWAATQVTLDAETKVTSPAIAASGDVYVPIGTELTPEKGTAGDSYTAFIAVTGTKRAATTEGTFTVSGKEPIKVYAAYKATLADGLKATVAGTDYTGTIYVDQAEKVAVAASSSDQIAVEKKAPGQLFGAAYAAGALTADTEFLAMTKITLTNGKVKLVTIFNQVTGSHTEVSGAVTGADAVVGVLEGETITVTGTGKTGGETVTATTASGALTAISSTAATTSKEAEAAFKVGTEAITVTEA